jgi:hypothetical protein
MQRYFVAILPNEKPSPELTVKRVAIRVIMYSLSEQADVLLDAAHALKKWNKLILDPTLYFSRLPRDVAAYLATIISPLAFFSVYSRSSRIGRFIFANQSSQKYHIALKPDMSVDDLVRAAFAKLDIQYKEGYTPVFNLQGFDIRRTPIVDLDALLQLGSVLFVAKTNEPFWLSRIYEKESSGHGWKTTAMQKKVTLETSVLPIGKKFL